MAKIMFSTDLAKILGWSTVRTKRWMKSTGCGRKRGRFWITTQDLLLKHFPEAAEYVFLAGVEEESDDD